MKRLALALSILLVLNLLTSGIRWLIATQQLPLANLWLFLLITVGVVALVYCSTLEASPRYSVYHPEAKVYALAGLAGVVLGLL